MSVRCERQCPDNYRGECLVGGCREMCGGGCVEPLPEWYYGDDGGENGDDGDDGDGDADGYGYGCDCGDGHGHGNGYGCGRGDVHGSGGDKID